MTRLPSRFTSVQPIIELWPEARPCLRTGQRPRYTHTRALDFFNARTLRLTRRSTT